MAPTTAEAFTALLSEERGGVKLPTPVVKRLVKYYLETAELSDVKEFSKHGPTRQRPQRSVDGPERPEGDRFVGSFN